MLSLRYLIRMRRMGTRPKMKLLLLCLCLYVGEYRTLAVCVDESPIPPIIPPTTWTVWYSVDTPEDGTEDETLTNVRLAYPSVCASPTDVQCRTKFLHNDHVTAGQVLANACSTTAGLLCRQSDQTNLARCLDYEIRFQCPSPNDALPEPHFYWDLSTKVSADSEEPLLCDGSASSIYANVGGMPGTVHQSIYLTHSFDSSDHLCAVHSPVGTSNGWIDFGSMNDKCISDPACCTAGFTISFWLRSRIPDSTANTLHLISTGGQNSRARGVLLFYSAVDFKFTIRGATPSQYYRLSTLISDIPYNQWTFHTFTFKPNVFKHYMNGTLHNDNCESFSDNPKSVDFDNLVVFRRSNDPVNDRNPVDADMSNFRIFYRNFSGSEVNKLYLQETSESKVVVHYLRKQSHVDSLGVELECLAKAGSSPTIVWHRSHDGIHFEPVLPSLHVVIYESSPNSYRQRSILIVRDHTWESDVTFACEALDTSSGGGVSKTITIPKRSFYWSTWLSDDTPTNGDDKELLAQHLQAYDVLCKYPRDIRCRTVYDGISSNETGQMFNISCSVSSGMECLGSDQSAAQAYTCYDYKVQYQCPEPKFYWTSWYDASDPDGSMEDETFSTHVTQAYPDFCSDPIGAECRVKSTTQDLLASAIVPEVPYLCNANGFRCQHADNIGPCPDMEVRYMCPDPTITSVTIDRQSHHLDPKLKVSCDVTSATPPNTIQWGTVNSSTPLVATALTTGGVVTVTDALTSSVITIDDYVDTLFTNSSIVCTVREGIVIETTSVFITRPSTCERSVGISSGLIDITQLTPSSVKTLPFEVPGLDGLHAWIAEAADSTPTLSLDFGIDFEISGVAIQGDPTAPPPTHLVTNFRLYHKSTSAGGWNMYTDGGAVSEFTTDYGAGTASFTTLTPHITARYIDIRPTTWTPAEMRMRTEVYGCGVGASTLQILALTKRYDVISNNFTFACSAQHFPVPAITWLADNVTISPREGVFQISNMTGPFPSSLSVLILLDFHPSNDSITFTCKATGGDDVQRASISAEYSFSGSISISGGTDVYVGTNVIMTCTASGDEVYEITWGRRPALSFDPYTKLQPDAKFLISTVENSATNVDSTLTINQYAQLDDGEYACLVNSDTARETILLSAVFGLRAGWSNATYDEKANVYLLECGVIYANTVPDVTWVIPNGQRVDQSIGRYQVTSHLLDIGGNLTKVSTLAISDYTHSSDDGTYMCSNKVAGQSINTTVQTQYAYLGPVFASVTKATNGQPVYFTCVANDVTQVYHADWLRVTGADRVPVERDATHVVHATRSGGTFRLNLDIHSFSNQDQGDYICSINNGTAESSITLSGPLGHGHSHGGCSGGDDHDHDPPDRGTEFSLYTKIDTDRVECLNEVTDGSGKLVFKPWDERLDTQKFVESDDDEELLFNIPFTGNVKLKGVIVIGGNTDTHPAEMRLYKNQTNMTFDDTRSDPDQVFEMQRDSSGILEYNTKIAKFSNVNHLSIHFSKNFGAETTIVYYIGLRGEFTEARRQEIMVVQYEAYANPKDHKTSLHDNVHQQIK